MALSRRHWRYIVRDQYGYVIQNAKVNVYQPGTSNAFLGSAFTADTGGSGATNPFTTNAQGEVEAWFDTAQVVDVQVDDNTDTAYRAVNGASATVSFSTFTDSDNIAVDPVDLPTTIGTAADLTDITAGAQTEVVGTSTRWTPMDHVHGHSALMAVGDAPTAHSHSVHTDSTRSFFLPVLDVVNDGGTVATRGTAPAALRVVTLADAATSGMSWVFNVPNVWASGSLSCEIWHAGQTTTSGSVRWTVESLAVAEGSSVVAAAGTSTTFTGQAPTTADLLVKEALQTMATPATNDDFYRVSVRRIGADGADTYAASTSLIGINIFYTASN